MIINLILYIVIGFVVGYLAKLVMPGPDGGGFILTTILGIVGALVGGFIGANFFGAGGDATNSFNLVSLIFSVIGGIIVLAIYRLATGRSLKG